MAGHEVEDTRTPCEVLLWDQEEKEAGYIYQVGFVTIILFLELLLRELPFLKRLQDWVPKSVLLIFVGLGWGGILKWQVWSQTLGILSFLWRCLCFSVILEPTLKRWLELSPFLKVLQWASKVHWEKFSEKTNWTIRLERTPDFYREWVHKK